MTNLFLHIIPNPMVPGNNLLVQNLVAWALRPPIELYQFCRVLNSILKNTYTGSEDDLWAYFGKDLPTNFGAAVQIFQ